MMLPDAWDSGVLSDLCSLRKETCNPIDCNLDIYVGLEHIESGKFFLKKHGLPKEVKSTKNRFYAGDVIYGKLRPYLDKAVVSESEGICSTDILVFMPKANVPQSFLAGILHCDKFIQHAVNTTHGVNHPRTSWKSLKDYETKIPPLKEQEKIATVLLKIQQAIEVQESIIETTKELKKSTMQHVFTYGLRGKKTKETEIGRMPESWEVKQIGDFCKVQGGYAFKSSDYQKNGIKLFKISNVSFGKTVWVETSFLSTSYIEKYSEYLLMPGDLLMAMTRPIVSGGIKITRLRNEDCPCLLNQRVARFNISLSINKEYLFQVLFNPYFINAIGLGALGSQQPNISATQIEQIRIPFTDLDEQKQLVDILKSIDKKIEVHTSKKITLLDLFKTMLNKLMTGEIRVKDLDIDMADVKH